MAPEKDVWVDLVHALLGNAGDLTSDAKLLFDHGRFSRSYALAALAGEELGKISICLDWVLGDPNMTEKQQRKAWQDHKDKLMSLAAYSAAFVEDPTTLQPKRLKKEVQQLAGRKMDAIYVDVRDGRISTPQCIGEIETRELLSRVDDAITHAVENLGQLSVEVADAMDGLAPKLIAPMETYFDSLPPHETVQALRRLMTQARTLTNEQWADALENETVAELLDLSPNVARSTGER
jgi:AbiV family abortive infection protein